MAPAARHPRAAARPRRPPIPRGAQPHRRTRARPRPQARTRAHFPWSGWITSRYGMFSTQIKEKPPRTRSMS